MKRHFMYNAGLLLLAIVFSVGPMFAFIELPGLLDAGLQNNLGFPRIDQGIGAANALKTELFIQGLHLRWIGYGSLLLIAGLIIVGYSTRRSGWALAGDQRAVDPLKRLYGIPISKQGSMPGRG